MNSILFDRQTIESIWIASYSRKGKSIHFKMVCPCHGQRNFLGKRNLSRNRMSYFDYLNDWGTTWSETYNDTTYKHELIDQNSHRIGENSRVCSCHIETNTENKAYEWERSSSNKLQSGLERGFAENYFIGIFNDWCYSLSSVTGEPYVKKGLSVCLC